ncbi:hypothetical protein GHO25_19180 [Pseudomonas sp. FSL R10-1350]|uniref:hypothetical protein n=1 Tax=Pseudomonas TaxID=286 RepID=UPI0006537CD3|nr:MULTISPECIES: hypothetical protein [Pseudomonas]KMN08491.1 hypothetical protein TU84_15560 [Pseudomonas helleri]MQT60368.1 hypothetical protein [Pseudomonas sp. FSL R10-0399]MQU65238.1 hypothetical protein [Pseudomonas sp. FSL R10-1350]
MTIALHLLVIILSLGLVRYLGPKWLIPIGIVWSAVTVFTLFWPPLIALQLSVIWATVWLLKAHAAKSRQDETSRQPAYGSSAVLTDNKAIPQTSAYQDSIKSGEINWRPDEPAEEPHTHASLDHDYHQQEIMAATGQMLASRKLEQDHIESILARAEKHHQTALKLLEDESFKRGYEEAYAMYEALLRGEKAATASIPFTDFSRPDTHVVKPVDDAIQNTFESSANEYSAFLKNTVVRLQQRKGLRELFEKEMLIAGGSQVLNRIKSFEAGDEWRYADRRKKVRGTLADRQLKA